MLVLGFAGINTMVTFLSVIVEFPLQTHRYKLLEEVEGGLYGVGITFLSLGKLGYNYQDRLVVMEAAIQEY